MPCSNALAPFVIAALVALGPPLAGAQNNAAPPLKRQSPTRPSFARCVTVRKVCRLLRTRRSSLSQHESSLLIALQEYRNGARTDDLMGRIAKNLSDDDMKALAAYFSALPWPAYRE